MTQLPAAFTERTRQLMGEERFERYLQSFEEEPPVSIRVNPRKMNSQRHTLTSVRDDGRWQIAEGTPVPWCRNGYYLQKRPNFTMDPLLHAGCYYVQEAASMFLDEALRQHLTSAVRPLTSLDMCAAPGGKSTLLRSVLPEDCVLYSNEPIRNRANILLENVTKWGYDNHIVTNNYPNDYRASKLRFDVILCDVPCSGEGMFRKDPATIREWSPQNVEKCWQLQREIYIAPAPSIPRKTRKTSVISWSSTTIWRCYPLTLNPNGTSPVPCSMVSTNPSIVSSLASLVARDCLCAC